MTDLAVAIADQIRATGPMTFADFVALALYHPTSGYYSRSNPPMVRTGDYLTAPETHPLFGWLLGRQVVHLAGLFDSGGAPFAVIELGPGTGALAAGVLDYCRGAAPDLYQRLRYTLIEISPALRARQAARLARHADRVAWADWTDLAPGGRTGVVLANEFFDALPFHRVQMTAGQLQEIWVDLIDGELADRPGPLSTPALAEYFDRLGRQPPVGGQVEVSLAAVGVLESLTALFQRGVLIAIDYGYEVAEWLGRVRPRGTFLAHYRHQANDQPYQRIGRQDLTAHVDWTTLQVVGQQVGWRPIGLLDQRAYLAALGLTTYGAALAARSPRQLPPAERRRNEAAATALIDPAGLGRFQVLALGRGVPDLTLDQLLDLPEPAGDPERWPLLPPAEPPADPFADLWQEVFGAPD